MKWDSLLLLGLGLLIGGLVLFFWPKPVKVLEGDFREGMRLKVENLGGSTRITAREGAKKGGKVIESVIATYGHGFTISQSKGGQIAFKAKDRGWTFQPGGYVDTSAIGVGLELGYLKRSSVLLGCGVFDLVEQRAHPSATIALGYHLPVKRLNNVTTYLGYSTDRRIVGGLFIQFGGGD